MENVKFIKRITEDINRPRIIIGNCIYYVMKNTNSIRVKTYCEKTGVMVEIISIKEGLIDKVFLPFANYFSPKQCSPGAPMWNQHIDNGHWYFEHYTHALPTDEDFKNLAEAIEMYMNIFGSELNYG